MSLDATAVRIDESATVLVGDDAAQVVELIRLDHGLVALLFARGEVER